MQTRSRDRDANSQELSTTASEIQMATKRKRRGKSAKSDSGVSSSSNSVAKLNVEGPIIVKNNTNPKEEDIKADLLPFKKRKHNLQWQPNLSPQTIKNLEVSLVNMFEDKNLTSRYNLRRKKDDYVNKRQVDSQPDRVKSKKRKADVPICVNNNEIPGFINKENEEQAPTPGVECSNFSGRAVSFSNNMITITRHVDANSSATIVKRECVTPETRASTATFSECSGSYGHAAYIDDSGNVDDFYQVEENWTLKYIPEENELVWITSYSSIFSGGEMCRSGLAPSPDNIPESLKMHNTNPPTHLRSLSNENQNKNITTKNLTVKITSSQDNRRVIGNGNADIIFDLRTKLQELPRDFPFKQPLPPAKRPPGRPRRDGASSTLSSLYKDSENSDLLEEKDDDSLSLCASSFFDDFDDSVSTLNKRVPDRVSKEQTMEQVQDVSHLSIEEDSLSKSVSLPGCSSWSQEEEEPIVSKTNDIRKWVESACRQDQITDYSSTPGPVEPLSLNSDSATQIWPSVSNNPSPERMEFEEVWESAKESESTSPFKSNSRNSVAGNNSGTSNIQRRDHEIDDKRKKTNYASAKKDVPLVPSFLNNVLCFKVMNRNFCKFRDACRFSHVITPAIREDISNMSLDKLRMVYDWALKSNSVHFGALFSAVVEGFAKLERTVELTNLVDDILHLEVLDRTPLIKDIVNGLMKTGMNFKQVIKELILVQGCRDLCFADILLNLIIERKNLLEYFPLIQKVIRYRTQEIDYGCMIDIIQQSIDIDSPQLYTSISQSIIDKELVNFKNIDKDLLTKYLGRLSAHKLYDQYYLLRSKTGIYPNFTGNTPPTSGETRPNVTVESPFVGEFDDVDDDNEETDLSPDEMYELCGSLKKETIDEFVSLLHRYKGTNKVNSFAVNTVVTLNNMDTTKSFWRMLKSVELVFPNFMKDAHLKAVIEQISYNVLDILTKNDEWQNACQILLKFIGDLDTFLMTREFKKVTVNPRSVAAKYLYVCKILVRGDHISEALTILLRPDLNFMKSREHWKLCHQTEDEIYRNVILKELLNKALEIPDLSAARTVIFQLIDEKYFEIDPFEYLNRMLIKMLDRLEVFIEDLKKMFSRYILHSWYKRLNTQALRGLCICLVSCIAERDAMELYNKCSKRGVYHFYKGVETEITLKTDMVKEEIYLALTVFFHKLAKVGGPVRDLKIHVECPNKVFIEPKALLNSDAGFREMKLRIGNVLLKAFGLIIESDACVGSTTYLILRAHVYMPLIEKYRFNNK